YFLEVVVKHPNKRVELGKHKRASRLKEVLYHFSPLVKVGQPAYGAIAGEYNVELLLQMVRQIIHITANKACGYVYCMSQFAGFVYGSVREVDTGNVCAHTPQRKRVLSKVALQVQYLFACNIAQQVEFYAV